mgnify:CR=1 FL=1
MGGYGGVEYVNLIALDGGFSEWKVHFWVPSVKAGAERRGYER